MGYYVTISRSNITIKKEHFEAAYDALCAINAPEYNHLKNGGSYGPDGKTEFWYSWMPANYPAETETLVDILELLGFDLGYDMDGSIIELGYDNKTGNEDVFFMALAPFIENGSSIIWQGEDNSLWGWEFADGQMYMRDVSLGFTGERFSPTYLHVNEDMKPGTEGRLEYREMIL